ncbi:uncharacterized protein DEA37_0000987 [Paragonimus westermani]|uniref:Glycosyl transferase 64 domain-containing protein n=1 Tax=Paragonimus westermani TaxID=34504 RepID=A0A5J4NXD8_9TREM|nr:uncharacterized protein DEA37_0000987 [Paragonimus westermani]
MPPALRTIVDEYMNCEDIAFNFWVAHLTRKTPIHVSNQDDFGCLLCGGGLSWNRSHGSVRSNCITWFSNIFRYNPLLYSTFRLVHRNQSMTAAC